MSFLRDKDTRLNENAKAAQENARLAIEKQRELIRCLANISFVLGKGLGVAREEPPPDKVIAEHDGDCPLAAETTPPTKTNATKGL
jgi:hypothetical protein